MDPEKMALIAGLIIIAVAGGIGALIFWLMMIDGRKLREKFDAARRRQPEDE